MTQNEASEEYTTLKHADNLAFSSNLARTDYIQESSHAGGKARDESNTTPDAFNQTHGANTLNQVTNTTLQITKSLEQTQELPNQASTLD